MTKPLKIRSQLPDGSACTLHMSAKTLQRLAGTHFRGQNVELAGNCIAWGTPKEMLGDSHVRAVLKDHALTLIESHESSAFLGGANRSLTGRLQMEHATFVGWSSTIGASMWGNEQYGGWIVKGNSYTHDEFRTMEINNHTTALRFRGDIPVPAPYTKQLTITYVVAHHQEGWHISIKSIYPGRDVGRLSGNMTKRKNVIFFPFNWHGRPIKIG